MMVDSESLSSPNVQKVCKQANMWTFAGLKVALKSKSVFQSFLFLFVSVIYTSVIVYLKKNVLELVRHLLENHDNSFNDTYLC